MAVKYTKHAEEKLNNKESKLLGITRRKVSQVIREPISVNKNVTPHRSTGDLNKVLSLVVIWKIGNGIIKIITFYPAKKGRYESKIL